VDAGKLRGVALAYKELRESKRLVFVGLTDEDLEAVFPAIATYHESNKTLYRSIAHAIEAKLKEKNT